MKSVRIEHSAKDLPVLILTILSDLTANSILWVTITTAISLCFANSSKTSKTASELELSKLPVGSSAKIKLGEFASALVPQPFAAHHQIAWKPAFQVFR